MALVIVSLEVEGCEIPEHPGSVDFAEPCQAVQNNGILDIVNITD
jgi:hypothetical protein